MTRETFRKQLKESIWKQIKIDVAKETINIEYTDYSIDCALYVLEESLKLSKIHNITPTLKRIFTRDDFIIYSVDYYVDLKNTAKYLIQKDLTIALYY